MNLFSFFHPVIFVATGAIIGALLRNELVDIFGLLAGGKYKKWSIFIVNLIATFSLGIFSGLMHSSTFEEGLKPMGLFFVVGLLGSFSTFSTFMKEIADHLMNKRIYQFFTLCGLSIFGSLLIAFIGFKLTTQLDF